MHKFLCGHHHGDCPHKGQRKEIKPAETNDPNKPFFRGNVGYLVETDKDNIEKLNESSWVKLNGNENNLTSGTYRLSFTNQNDKVVYVITSF